jgi:clan AA aspartic protease (TIGR02281 family)
MENSRRVFGPFAVLLAIAGLWGLVGLAVNGWHFHDDAPPAASRSGELATPLDGDQCRVDVWASAVSGAGARFTAVLDSGSGSALSLTRADAATAGVDVGSLWFIIPYHSVSGLGWQARTSLRQFRIGGAVLRDVPAYVISETGGMDVSLVGLPLLKLLNFSLRGDSCVVSW